ncbi:MAG: DUF1385 domain-containing protein [Clostridia bacterium]|nr:DUF1385 domain-containing protein [Clostridia bacterium]MBQ8304016.1 DUF1385 domain-containing protein [Clostridia bacterium]
MSKCKYTSIGGQALIEGIMMKGKKKTAMAVRNKDGEILLEPVSFTSIKEKYKFLGAPVIRGVVNFIESMVQGYSAMMKSADLSGFAEDEEEKESLSGGTMGVIGVVAFVLALVLAVALFMYLPALLFDGLNFLAAGTLTPLKSLFEGLLKLAVFVAYVAGVSAMKDIKRVFAYHGAEHKTIFCFEKGLPLTVENVRAQKRLHPRCGTSFMILIFIVSIIISTLIQTIFPTLILNRFVWVAVKILIIPLVCGLGYELIKICGKYDNLLTKIVAFPGLQLQRLTTKEPDDDMIEVAIAALNAVLEDEDREQLN